MKRRKKARRRLLTAGAAVTVVVAVGSGLFVARKVQIGRELQAHRTAGLAAVEAGDFPQAMAELGRYLPKREDDLDAMVAMADARRQTPSERSAHIVEALGLYRRVVDLDPTHEHGWRWIVRLSRLASFNTELLAAADRLLAIAPGDAEASLAKATALVRLRREKEAADLLGKALADHPQDVELHGLRFTMVHQLGQPIEALIEDYAGRVRAEADQGLWRLLHGMALIEAQQYADGRGELLAAADAPLPDPKARELLAVNLQAAGLGDRARELLEAWVQGDPDAEALRTLLLARLWQDAGFERILQLTERGGAQWMRSPGVLGLRGVALAHLERWGEAEAIAQGLRSRDVEPAAVAWGGLVEALVAWDRRGAAAARGVLSEVLRHAPAHAYSRFYLGKALAELGEYALAIGELERVASERPAWAQAHLEIAGAALRAGQRERALQAAVQANQRGGGSAAGVALASAVTSNLQPGDTENLKQLLTLLDELGGNPVYADQALSIRVTVLTRFNRMDQAVAAIDAALAEPRELSPELLLNLASLSDQYAIGRYEILMQRYRAAYGDTPEAVFLEAVRLIRQGRQDEAIASLPAAPDATDPQAVRRWAVARARVLDAAGADGASAAWLSLSADYPQDPDVHRLILASRAAQADPELLRAAASRLRQLLGDQSLEWRAAYAVTALRRGADEAELREAASLLEDLLRVDAQRHDARLLLVSVYEAMGRVPDAARHLGSVIEARPGDLDLRLRAASLAVQRRDATQAAAQLDAVVASPAATPDQLRQAGRMLFDQAERSRAAEAIGRIPESRRTPADQSVLAMIHASEGSLDQATRLVTESIAGGELTPPRIHAAIEVLAAAGDEVALAALEHRVRADEALASVERALALSHLASRRGDPEAAVTVLEQAVEATPASTTAWSRLLLALQDADHVEAMVPTARRALGAADDPEPFRVLAESPAAARWVASPRARILVRSLLEQPDQAAVTAEALEKVDQFEQGKTDVHAAATALSVLARQYPNHLALQLTAIDLGARAGRIDDAVALAREAASVFPAAVGPRRLETVLLSNAGRFVEALAAGQAWRRLAGARAQEAELFVAQAELQLGRAAAALDRLTPLHAARPGDDNVTGLYIKALWANGKVDAAETVLAPRLAGSPSARGLWITLARQLPADRGAVWLSRVEASMSPDAFAERVALASAWAALAPRLPGARGTDEAARVLHRLGEYPDAPPIVPLHLGMLAELRGDLKRAEVHYRQALQADPDTALALNNLAMLLVKQGRQLDEAASLADRLVKIDDDPNYLDTLAMAQAAQGLLEPAIRTIQRAVDADPTSVAWRIRLARLLSMDDRMEEARRVFDRVLAEGVSSQALPPELLEDYQMLRMALYAGGNG